jgi:hypothetical protein
MTDGISNEKRPSAGTGTNYGTRDDIGVFRLTPKDTYIRRYNHLKLSYSEISKRLKLEHGIELSKSSIARRIKELRQDPSNGIQTRKCTIPLKPREQTRWFKIIKRLQEAIPEYVRIHGFKPSSRTMFYQLQDEKLVKKQEHNSFVNKTVEARLGWVDADGKRLWPELDIDCFADDDSRKEVGEYDDSEPTDPTEPGLIPDPDDYIDSYIEDLNDAIQSFDGKGEEGEPGEIGGRWYNQPEYVEVWEEKVDLLPGFEKILSDKDVKIRANHGFASLIFLYKCCNELKALIEEKGFDPKHIHIKYCGDWDPSGEIMVYYIQKRLRQLGIFYADVRRITVTPEQIDEYNLPLMSLEGNDLNLREFKRRYGDKATHLNAFFTEAHIDDFANILRNAVDEHWDQSIYDEMVAEYDGAEPDEPESMDEDELNDAKELMCKKATEAFYHGWGADDGYYDLKNESDDEEESGANEE